MLIDLHNHTSVSSSCSLLSTEELIEAARVSGLDGICVTDHLVIEGAEVAQEYGRKVGFTVFRGIEARSRLGDMLVFGLYEDIPEGISLDDLCWQVHQVGGVLFAAHPFHTTGGANLYASLLGQGLDLEMDWYKVPKNSAQSKDIPGMVRNKAWQHCEKKLPTSYTRALFLPKKCLCPMEPNQVCVLLCILCFYVISNKHA